METAAQPKWLQSAMNMQSFKTVALTGTMSVTPQSAAVFKATSVHRDDDETTIRWSRVAISFWSNGVKLELTCYLFVIIWCLTVINHWKSQICCPPLHYYSKVQPDWEIPPKIVLSLQNGISAQQPCLYIGKQPEYNQLAVCCTYLCVKIYVSFCWSKTDYAMEKQ